MPTPLSVHVYPLVWRQMILFAHNIVIYVVIAIIYPKPWSWAGLSATRYRDIGPLLFSVVQLLFFMTRMKLGVSIPFTIAA